MTPDYPAGQSVEDLAATERQRIPVAVDLERVFSHESRLDDLFEIGGKDRLSFRNDRIGAWCLGPILPRRSWSGCAVRFLPILSCVSEMSVIFMAG